MGCGPCEEDSLCCTVHKFDFSGAANVCQCNVHGIKLSQRLAGFRVSLLSDIYKLDILSLRMLQGHLEA